MWRTLWTCLALLVLGDVARGQWSPEIWGTNAHRRGMTVTTQVWARPFSTVVTNAGGVTTNRWLTNISRASNDVTQVLTNLTLEARDRRAYEASLAILERARWRGPGVFSGASGTNAFFFRDDSANVGRSSFGAANLSLAVSIAGNWAVSLPGWTKMTNGADFSGTQKGTATFGLERQHYWTNAHELCRYVGAPSNYLDLARTLGASSWWPYRAIDGTVGGLRRVETNRWIVQANTTNGPPYTNTTVDCWSRPVAITGAAGDVVVGVVTNTDIADGYTSADYGWRYMPALLNEMQWQAVGGWSWHNTAWPADGGDGPAYGWETNTTASGAWASAQAEAATNIDTSASSFLTAFQVSGEVTGSDLDTNWVAEIYAGSAVPVYGGPHEGVKRIPMATNWAHLLPAVDIDIYSQASAVGDSFNAFGSIFTTNGLTLLESQAGVSIASLPVTGGYHTATGEPVTATPTQPATNSAWGFSASLPVFVFRPRLAYTNEVTFGENSYAILTADVPAGASSVRVRGFRLRAHPARIFVTVSKPAAGTYNMRGTPVGSSSSWNECRVNLSGRTDSAGYRVTVLCEI